MNLLKDNLTAGITEPAFDLHSNRCKSFEIGVEEGNDVWLKGQIVGAPDDIEHVFNGRLFCANGGAATLIDGFPRSDPPAGWSKHPHMDGTGWSLHDADGETVFGFRLQGTTCIVTVGLHRSNGAPAALAGQGGLVTFDVPVRIG